ncbi:hypothetical protein DL93DRAFT_2234115 [Clavulina sp. PMI_390]|nr:hypothetical protein DL93DRAFT_2234115 [Clavulina sp. PMI_390]
MAPSTKHLHHQGKILQKATQTLNPSTMSSSGPSNMDVETPSGDQDVAQTSTQQPQANAAQPPIVGRFTPAQIAALRVPMGTPTTNPGSSLTRRTSEKRKTPDSVDEHDQQSGGPNPALRAHAQQQPATEHNQVSSATPTQTPKEKTETESQASSTPTQDPMNLHLDNKTPPQNETGPRLEAAPENLRKLPPGVLINHLIHNIHPGTKLEIERTIAQGTNVLVFLVLGLPADINARATCAERLNDAIQIHDPNAIVWAVDPLVPFSNDNGPPWAIMAKGLSHHDKNDVQRVIL